jgi:hypothetical protein
MGTHPATTVAEGAAFMQIVDGKRVDALSGRASTSSAPPTARSSPRSRPPARPMSTAR